MKNYRNIKAYDAAACKNIDENESRSENVSSVNAEIENLNVRNIHNKRKDYR